MDPGFFLGAPVASPEKLKRAEFRRAALRRLACRPFTNKQTDKPGGVEDLCRSGLPERNSDEMAKSAEDNLETEFRVVHNDATGIALRCVVLELERL